MTPEAIEPDRLVVPTIAYGRLMGGGAEQSADQVIRALVTAVGTAWLIVLILAV